MSLAGQIESRIVCLVTGPTAAHGYSTQRNRVSQSTDNRREILLDDSPCSDNMRASVSVYLIASGYLLQSINQLKEGGK